MQLAVLCSVDDIGSSFQKTLLISVAAQLSCYLYHWGLESDWNSVMFHPMNNSIDSSLI